MSNVRRPCDEPLAQNSQHKKTQKKQKLVALLKPRAATLQ
jgi:hypothetical protein